MASRDRGAGVELAHLVAIIDRGVEDAGKPGVQFSRVGLIPDAVFHG